MEENNEIVKKKSNKPIIFGLIGLAVVLIAVGLCMALGVFGGDKKEENEPKKE